MAWDDEDGTTVYHVVVNCEEQYSIWPDCKDMPQGWRAVGKTGGKQECLDHIKEVWTDMRPLSLRRRMETATRSAEPEQESAA
jgi:MbtH protein